ncbi:MAG: ABC-2 family transporter protein [Eubacteriales bacterium]|nr:ABC-2 family transporter protein [Eubacteriales bacterium]
MKQLKKYFALTRLGILETIQWRLALFVMVLGNLLYLTLIYFLWKAIFTSAGTDVVNGMTFEMTMVYLVLASSLYGVVELYLVWEIGRNIQNGKIVLDLLRPFKYKQYVFWENSGTLVVNFFVTFIPTFIIVGLMTKGTIPLGWNLVYFFVAFIFSIVINYNIDFIVGTICLYTESIWGINMMRQVIVSLLSGATIPLAFFPDRVASVVKYLPFRAIYDTPLTLLMTKNPDLQTVMSKLGMSLFWVVAISIFSAIFWRISIKQVTVNGG